MLHLVFAYSLQELLPDLSNSSAPASRQAELQWPWPNLGAFPPPVTGHRPLPASFLQPCFQPGLWSKPGFGVVPTAAREISYSYSLCVPSDVAKS